MCWISPHIKRGSLLEDGVFLWEWEKRACSNFHGLSLYGKVYASLQEKRLSNFTSRRSNVDSILVVEEWTNILHLQRLLGVIHTCARLTVSLRMCLVGNIAGVWGIHRSTWFKGIDTWSESSLTSALPNPVGLGLVLLSRFSGLCASMSNTWVDLNGSKTTRYQLCFEEKKTDQWTFWTWTYCKKYIIKRSEPTVCVCSEEKIKCQFGQLWQCYRG